MTEEDLQYIEEELGVSLPADYRALLREFPFPADGHTRADGLYENPDHIVNETRLPQEEGGYDKRNWKPTYVAIGQGEEDDSYQFDTYLIDSALNPSPIYLLSREDHSIVEKWPSLQVFFSDYREELAKWEAEQSSRERHAQEQRQHTQQMLDIIYLVILVVCLLIWLLIMRKRYTHLIQPLLTSCAFKEQGKVTERKASTWDFSFDVFAEMTSFCAARSI